MSTLFHWKYTSVFGVGGWVIGVSSTLADKPVLAFSGYAVGTLWIIGWWLAEHPVGKATTETASKKYKKRLFTRWSVPIVTLIATVAMCWYTLSLRRERLLTEYSGFLVPADEPTPPNSCPVSSANAAVLLMGNKGAVASHFPVTVIEMHGKPVLILDRDHDGNLGVSAAIFDDRYDWVATISDNKFDVDSSVRKSRKDFSELVVRIRHGDEEVLNVRYINRNAIRILGVFRTADRHEVKVTRDGFVSDGTPYSVADICAVGFNPVFKF